MNYRDVLRALAVLGAASASTCVLGAQVPAEPIPRPVLPNIVLIVADDVGWNDVGYHDPVVISPALDRLVAEGVRLERFYVAPICSPTRQALMTGRYPIRWGMERHVFMPWEERGLPRTEELLPEMLRAARYGATLVAGKWHLGHAYSKFHPLKAGFDEYLGNYNGAIDYYTHVREGERDWKLDYTSRPQDDGLYHTDLVGDHAVSFIAAHANDSKPFFLYVPFLAAHAPNQAPQADIDVYLNMGVTEPRATHLAMVTVMDRNIGKILGELDSRNIERNTVVWFLSDNGGSTTDGGHNGSLRGGKLTVYEGGIRVPAVLRYPRANLAAGTTYDDLISHVDVMPTLRGIIEPVGGSPAPTQNDLDGVDMFDALCGSAPAPDKEHYNFISLFDDGMEDLAVTTFVDGQMSWKLVWTGADFVLPPPAAAMIELFDLSLDPNETNEVSSTYPLVVQSLLARLDTWRSQRPTDGSGFEGVTKPPHWTARPEWAYIDQPTVCDSRYIVYRDSAAATFQRIGVANAKGSITDFGTTLNDPDGFDGLQLGGIGRNACDGLLYGVDVAGTTLYQIDVAGLVMKLGSISGLPGPVLFYGGDVQPNGQHLFVFDNGGNELYKIALDGLVAERVPLSGDVPSDGLAITDLAFDSSGDMLAYDEASQRVLTITKSGVVTQSTFTFGLGPNAAVWVDDGNDLFAYKRSAEGQAGGPGLYHVDLTTGALTLVATGTPVWSIDGAGCVSGP